MKRPITTVLLIALASAANAKTFDCRDATQAALAAFEDEDAQVLVVATINADGKTGTIEVADRKFNAIYQVEGIDRVWRFKTASDQKYGYLFLIQPDGDAAYYDHETSKGEPVYPDQEYVCEERDR